MPQSSGQMAKETQVADENDNNGDQTAAELRRAREDLKALRAQLKETQGMLDDERAAHTGAKGKIEELMAAARAESEASAKAKADLEAAHNQALGALRAETSAAKLQSALGIAAVKAGVHNTEDFLKLVDASKVTTGEDGAFVGVDEVVAEFKTSRPHMFGGTEPAPEPTKSKSTSSGNAPKPAPANGPQSVTALGEKEYAQARDAYLSGRA